MTPAPDLRAGVMVVMRRSRTRRFPDRLGQRNEIIAARQRRPELAVVPHEFPATRGCQADRMVLAQIVGVWLRESGQWPDDRS